MRYAFSLMLILLAGFPLHGEEMDWRGCIEYTRRNNPSLRSARETYNQVHAQERVALSAYLPSVSLEAGYSRAKNNQDAGGGSVNEYSLSVNARQLIYDGGKTLNDIRSAGSRTMAQENLYRQVSAEVREALRKAFIGYLKARDYLAITEGILERRRTNRELIRMRYQAGREHQGAVFQAEASYARAAADREAAARNLVLALRTLVKEMGGEEAEGFILRGVLETVVVGTTPDFDMMARNHPLVKKAAALREAAAYSLKIAEGGHYPQVYASASAGRSGETMPPPRGDWTLGVTATVPLYQGGQTTAEVSAARAQYEQTVADERNTRHEIGLELRKAWNDLLDAVAAVAVQDAFLKAAEERSRIAEAQYSIGVIQFDSWTIIEDDLVQARKSSLDARAAAMVSEAAWHRARGVILEDGI